MNFDFKNMETYHWFIAGGAGLAVIAVLMLFIKGGKLKVPAFLACAIGCLVLGFGAGIVTLGALGFNWNEKAKDEGEKPAGGAQGPPAGPGGGAGPGMGGAGVAPKGPNPKTQLAQLVVKLDQLTNAPLTVKLDDERKAKIAEQLKDLNTMENLSSDEAEKRLKALLAIVEKDRPTMTAAGYTWPGGKGGGGGGGGKDVPNPFTSETNKKALAGLQERVK